MGDIESRGKEEKKAAELWGFAAWNVREGFFDSTYQLSGDGFDASFSFARIANLRGGELQMRAFVRLAVGFNQSHLPCVICCAQLVTHRVVGVHYLVAVGELDCGQSPEAIFIYI